MHQVRCRMYKQSPQSSIDAKVGPWARLLQHYSRPVAEFPSQMIDYPLDSISVAGWKSLATIESLPLKQVNLLVGANGSGKSNFIGLFYFLHAIREGRLQEYVRRSGGAESLLYFGSRITKEIRIRISFGGGINQYSIHLTPTEEDTLAPDEEVVYFKGAGHNKPFHQALSPRTRGTEAGISSSELTGVGEWVRRRLDLWRVYHVHDTSTNSAMRKTAQVADNHFLRPDGSNLPAFLYLLQQRHSAYYKMIRAVVQQVAPFFDDFLLRPEALNQDTIRLAWKHKESEQYFGPAALSDGSIRFMVLATLFLQPENLRPSVILLDEPELGLHPFAIGMLAGLIKQASATTQIITSTQSPLLLDYFEPEDVLIAEQSHGATTLRRLESPKLKDWLQDYSLGQLWEKNELGGRPG
jgi:predicted ATPase